ncbi:zinc transporter 1-like, partial [Tropilaelaps mercedesae]
MSEGDDGEPILKEPERKEPSMFSEALRTSGSCISVVVCACVVHFAEGHWVVHYIDASLALIAVSIILFTFYPYVRDSGLILLQ